MEIYFKKNCEGGREEQKIELLNSKVSYLKDQFAFVGGFQWGFMNLHRRS